MSTEVVEKNGWFELLKKKKNYVIFVILMALIIILYFFLKRWILLYKEFSTALIVDGNIIYQIDTLREEKNKVILEGFVFKTDENSKEEEIDILLHDMESNKNIYLNTSSYNREDVNTYFGSELNYSYSGFRASIKKSSINLVDGKYQVYLRSDLTSGTYSALDEYLINGELTNVNLFAHEIFDFSNTELEELLQGAEIRVCRPDFGICIYQKDGELYWIANDSFVFEEDGSTFMQYQVSTTQKDKLPAFCIENGYDWVNLGFCFEDYEMQGEFGNYRVTKSTLPTTYSITDICTGFSNGSYWTWRQYFYPRYRFASVGK